MLQRWKTGPNTAIVSHFCCSWWYIMHFELLNCYILHSHAVKLEIHCLMEARHHWYAVMGQWHVKTTHHLPPNGGPSQLYFALGNFSFCLWHICVVHVRLVFQHVTCGDHWFDFSVALVCLLSSYILNQLMTPPSKLWGKAKTLSLVVFSFYLPFCQPVKPAEEWLWAVGCFFIIDSHVGVFYLSLYADA